jgi:hypothetical protein
MATYANLPTDLFDPDTFAAFVHPGEVAEIRVLQGSNVASGYFDDHAAFCKVARDADKPGANVYFTLQVIDPRLLGRALNRIRQGRGVLTTSDNNVLAYRWLPLDIDTSKPAGVSSGDSELKAAFEVREQVIIWVTDNLGFRGPIKAMSGNGYHLLYRLPDLPNAPENKALIKSMLEEVDVACSTTAVKIDTTVFNPARIWKLYGTTARKGDEIPAAPGREARPHRKSYIESLGDQL